jgi:hypothetical protein
MEGVVDGIDDDDDSVGDGVALVPLGVGANVVNASGADGVKV